METTETIALTLVSHTNVGKTTLARTLLRRDVGEVRDQAHVTEVSEAYPVIRAGEAELVLWDTPGFGDSVRLLHRLRNQERPVVWFLQQLWDRLAERPLWCSQQAVRNIRDDADVVLYLVNAAEEPAQAGYVEPELEILGWIGRPVLILLNQAAELVRDPGLAAARCELWRRHTARFENVRGVVLLDAFSRFWAQESLLFERVVELLPEEKRPAMRRLKTAWDRQNLEVFERSVEAMAGYLIETATDREPLPERRPSRSDKKQAMEALGERLEARTARLVEGLLAAHGLEGQAGPALARQLDAFVVVGEELVDPEKGAIWGGLLSGAATGLGADLLAGGLSFGGGLVAGAILGALGGAGLVRGYQLLREDQLPSVGFSPTFLGGLVGQTVLRYLAVAHFGRGRGEFRDGEEMERWRGAVKAALAREAAGWRGLWEMLGQDAGAAAWARGEIAELLDHTLREVLVAGYPEAAGLLEMGPEAPRALSVDVDRRGSEGYSDPWRQS